MNGLTYTEVILGILLPLVFGAYVYSWFGFGAVWKGIAELRAEVLERIQEVKENEIAHLEERVKHLEDDR